MYDDMSLDDDIIMVNSEYTTSLSRKFEKIEEYITIYKDCITVRGVSIAIIVDSIKSIIFVRWIGEMIFFMVDCGML